MRVTILITGAGNVGCSAGPLFFLFLGGLLPPLPDPVVVPVSAESAGKTVVATMGSSLAGMPGIPPRLISSVRLSKVPVWKNSGFSAIK